LNNIKSYAVIGSGISGLTCANILKENNKSVKVYEGRKNNGGLITCTDESGNLFHRVGGHVFNSKKNVVSEWFWKKFDKEKEFLKAKRNAVIYINKKFLKYPIELNLNELDYSTSKLIINELMDLTNKNIDLKSSNFEEFLNNNFGQTLCDIYFTKYNRKIWKRDLSKIPMEWLEGKLPTIEPREIILKNILKSKEDNMVHSTFYYPLEGGSQFIVNKLSRELDIRKESVESIMIKNNSLKINDNLDFYDGIIFTGDVRNLEKILDNKIIKDLQVENLLAEISLLDSNSTSTILCECDSNPYSWVYLPNENIKAHRIIMTGNFSERNNSRNLNKKRITCTIECSGKVDLESFKEELKKIPFNPKYLAYNFSKNSYIIQNSKTRMLISKLKKELVKKNIFLCGRFAEWEYFNMDMAIDSAMRVCNDDKV